MFIVIGLRCAAPAREHFRSNDIAGLVWTPVYQPLRSDPRFLEFLKKMKMPEYWRTAGWSEFCRPKGENDFECIGK